MQPKDVSAIIYIYTIGNGAIYFDDISLTGEIYTFGNGAGPVTYSGFKEPYAGTGELLPNTGFESLNSSGTGFEGWSAFGGWGNNQYVAVSADKVYKGTKSLKLTDIDGNKYPSVTYMIKNLVPGAEYQVSAWINADFDLNGYRGAGFKFEFYKGDTIDSGSAGSGDQTPDKTITTAGAWRQVVYYFTVPSEANSVLLYLRIYGAGIAYFDEVSCYRVTSSVLPFDFKTDNIFYYSDKKVGNASVKLIEGTGINFSLDAQVTFKLLDGERILKQDNIPLESGTVRFQFDLDLLSELKKEYKIGVIVADTLGNQYKTEQIIYKYDRPTALNKDGIYIRNGKQFDPVIGYHVGNVVSNNGKFLPFCVQAGINVVQTSLTTSVSNIISQLDIINSYGLMGLVCLYANMKPAAHESNLENTKKIVEAVKNHPAVFAFALIDEPSANITENRDELLRKSYITVREVDTHHPTYLVDFMEMSNIARYSDVFNIDNYVITKYGSNVKEVKSVTNDHKPIYTLLKAYGSSTLPTIDQIRYMAYDSFMEGAKSIGYYAIEDALSGPVALPDTQLGQNIIEFNRSGELKEAYQHFVHENYQLFNENMDSEVRWSSYIKDNNVYIVILNRTDETKSVNIPLRSFDNSMNINGFNAEALYGESDYIKSLGSTLQVDIIARHAAVYKITPKSINSVRNAGFEELTENNELAFWENKTGITLNNENKKEGNYSIQLNSNVNLYTKQLISLKPNTEYLLSGWYNNLISAKPYVKLEFYNNSDGNGYISSIEQKLNQASTNGWKSYEFRFITPPNTLSAILCLGTEAGTVLFDNISVLPEFTSLSFYGSEGNRLNEIIPDTITANLYYIDRTGLVDNITMIAVLYRKEGRGLMLQDISEFKSLTVLNGLPLSISTKIQVLDDNNEYAIKILIWDSVALLKPYNSFVLE